MTSFKSKDLLGDEDENSMGSCLLLCLAKTGLIVLEKGTGNFNT